MSWGDNITLKDDIKRNPISETVFSHTNTSVLPDQFYISLNPAKYNLYLVSFIVWGTEKCLCLRMSVNQRFTNHVGFMVKKIGERFNTNLSIVFYRNLSISISRAYLIQV